MNKNTSYFIIGLGIASILAGAYQGYSSSDFFDSISGIIIGVALIGTAILEKKKHTDSE